MNVIHIYLYIQPYANCIPNTVSPRQIESALEVKKKAKQKQRLHLLSSDPSSLVLSRVLSLSAQWRWQTLVSSINTRSAASQLHGQSHETARYYL